MPRAAYTGSSALGVFWGGDIGGTPEGLRAEIIAVQRAAVMGYPNWGSDTCGYNQQSADTEVCGRWLAFSCFTPIMEVGPTQNRAFWNFHTPPRYDPELIAIWRLYARLHTRLAGLQFCTGQTRPRNRHAHCPPVVPGRSAGARRVVELVDVSLRPGPAGFAVWQKGQRTQEVYLPSGSQWRDAWHPEKIYDGGQTITVNADFHQLPIFVRVGSKFELGDLNREWDDAAAAANTRPDLRQLDAEVKAWFDKEYPSRHPVTSDFRPAERKVTPPSLICATAVKVTWPNNLDAANGQFEASKVRHCRR